MTNDILVVDFFLSFTIFSQTFSTNGEFCWLSTHGAICEKTRERLHVCNCCRWNAARKCRVKLLVECSCRRDAGGVHPKVKQMIVVSLIAQGSCDAKFLYESQGIK